MPDMLVKLYDLAPSDPEVARLRERGVTCRRAEAYERSAVLAFARARFPAWGDEVTRFMTPRFGRVRAPRMARGPWTSPDLGRRA